jgi:hypothetical protein
MSTLYNQAVAVNYNKVQTSTNLGGRELKFYVLYAFEDFYLGDPALSVITHGAPNATPNGYNRLWSEPGSRYEQAVHGIQQYAELFFLGEPTQRSAPGNYEQESFVFAVAVNTTTVYDDPKASLSQGLIEALGHDNFDIAEMAAVGNTFETI